MVCIANLSLHLVVSPVGPHRPSQKFIVVSAQIILGTYREERKNLRSWAIFVGVQWGMRLVLPTIIVGKFYLILRIFMKICIADLRKLLINLRRSAIHIFINIRRQLSIVWVICNTIEYMYVYIEQ